MKVVSIVGARPQFIKAAVLGAEFSSGQVDHRLVHTGQHYDYLMSRVFFDELGLQDPDYNLEVGSSSHALQTGEMMKRLEPILQAERPDWVVVYGDTNSTLAGALVAAQSQIRTAHVEAGLRSYNRAMPEELNRVITDHVADLHFAPTANAAANLAKEGVIEGVHVVGDLMIDSLRRVKPLCERREGLLERLQLEKYNYAVATVHRASNADDRAVFGRIVQGLRRLNLRVVFPVHPRTAPLAGACGIGREDNVLACEPLSYVDMITLQMYARVILTDSGGMQKEAYALEVPCVTLREETEWVETLSGGWNALAGSDPALIERLANRPLPVRRPPPVFGDGRTAPRITSLLARTERSQDKERDQAVGATRL